MHLIFFFHFSPSLLLYQSALICFCFYFGKINTFQVFFCMLPISGSCGWEIERYKLCALQFSDSRIIYRAFEPISFHFCWMPVKRREDKLTSQLGAEMEIWLKRRRRRAWLVETQLGDVRHACGNLVRHHIIHLLAANHPMRTTMITWGIILLPFQTSRRAFCSSFQLFGFPKSFTKKIKNFALSSVRPLAVYFETLT